MRSVFGSRFRSWLSPLVLLLIVMVFMAIRDGRPFFADVLKVTALVIAILVAVFKWLPLVRVR